MPPILISSAAIREGSMAGQDQGGVKRSGEGEARCERDGNSRNLLNIAAGGGFPRIQYCHRNLLELTQQKTYFGTFTI